MRVMAIDYGEARTGLCVSDFSGSIPGEAWVLTEWNAERLAERIAAEYADHVYLGVGLHSGYGAAQRMYVKRGYIPDGSGVWYGDKVCPQYTPCCNDDDLVLYLSKRLK